LQLFGACVLAHVAARAGLQRACGIHGFRVHAENQNAYLGAHADEPAQELNAADPRQMQVEQDEIGLLSVYEGQGFAPRRRVKDLDVWQRHQQAPQAVSHDGVIVHNENLHDSISVSGIAGSWRGTRAVTLVPLPST
jgi:hypothetical protein